MLKTDDQKIQLQPFVVTGQTWKDHTQLRKWKPFYNFEIYR